MRNMLLELLRQQQTAGEDSGVELRAVKRPQTAPPRSGTAPAASHNAAAAAAATADRTPSLCGLEDVQPLVPWGASPARPASAAAAARLNYGPDPSGVKEAEILSEIGQDLVDLYPEGLRGELAQRPKSAPLCHEILRAVEAKKEKRIRERPPPRTVYPHEHHRYVACAATERKILKRIGEQLDDLVVPGQPLPGKEAWSWASRQDADDGAVAALDTADVDTPRSLTDVTMLVHSPVGRGRALPATAAQPKRARNHKVAFFNTQTAEWAAVKQPVGWFENSSSVEYLDQRNTTAGVELHVGGATGVRTLKKTVRHCRKIQAVQLGEAKARAAADAATAAAKKAAHKRDDLANYLSQERIMKNRAQLADEIRAMTREINLEVDAVRKQKGFRAQPQVPHEFNMSQRSSQLNTSRRPSMGPLEHDARCQRLGVMFSRWTAHAQEYMKVLGSELQAMDAYKRKDAERALLWEEVLVSSRDAFDKVMALSKVVKMRGADWRGRLAEYLKDEGYPSPDAQPWPDRMAFVDFLAEEVCRDMNASQFEEFTQLLSATFTTEAVIAEEQRRFDDLDPVLFLLGSTSPTIAVNDPSTSAKAATRREQVISHTTLAEYFRVADRHLAAVVRERGLKIGSRFAATRLAGYSLRAILPALRAVSVFEVPHTVARRCILEALDFATALEFDVVMLALWLAVRAVVFQTESARNVVAACKSVYRLGEPDLEWILRTSTPRRVVALHATSHFDIHAPLAEHCQRHDIPLSCYYISHLGTEELLLRHLPSLITEPNFVLIYFPATPRNAAIRNIMNGLQHLPVQPSATFRCFFSLAPCPAAAVPATFTPQNAVVVNVDTVRAQPRNPDAAGDATGPWVRAAANETEIYPLRHMALRRP